MCLWDGHSGLLFSSECWTKNHRHLAVRAWWSVFSCTNETSGMTGISVSTHQVYYEILSDLLCESLKCRSHVHCVHNKNTFLKCCRMYMVIPHCKGRIKAILHLLWLSEFNPLVLEIAFSWIFDIHTVCSHGCNVTYDVPLLMINPVPWTCQLYSLKHCCCFIVKAFLLYLLH